jgi:tetratricopeptide (TPR) repeat protein
MIHCQRCKSANPFAAEYCLACGTPLHIITRPRGYVFDYGEAPFEEHLLERISALEVAVQRANERFEQLLDLAQQQATGSFFNHMMLEAMADLLSEHGLLDQEELEQRWKIRIARHYEESIERDRLDERCDRIIALHKGKDLEKFADLVDQGVILLGEGQMRRGLRLLETALALDEDNPELTFILGEYFFHLGKAAEAYAYLQQAVHLDGSHFGAHLLLGLLNGDEGETEIAKEHLQQALELDRNSFAAHYGLGRLLARERNLTEALTHLKRALALQPAPEMHYLVGRIYWEQGRADQALKHLQKAVRLDPRFDAALYDLGLLYWQSNRPNEAQAHFRAAYEINPRVSHYRLALQANAGEELPLPPAINWSSFVPTRKTKVSESRFIELLRRDLNTFSLSPLHSRKKS